MRMLYISKEAKVWEHEGCFYAKANTGNGALSRALFMTNLKLDHYDSDKEIFILKEVSDG